MRRWGSVLLVGASVVVGPIVTAAPAHAACVAWFGQCNDTPPTTAPPTTTPPTTAPPEAPSAAPTPAAAVSADEAASMFFDATNGARAVAGLPPLAWRQDV